MEAAVPSPSDSMAAPTRPPQVLGKASCNRDLSIDPPVLSLEKDFAVLRVSSPAAFNVSADYNDEGEATVGPNRRQRLEAKGAFAPTSPGPSGRSPASLVWGESGWHTGSLMFPSLAPTESTTPRNFPKLEGPATGETAHAITDRSDGTTSDTVPSADTSTSSASTSGPVPAPQAFPRVIATRKKLEPTAQPFAPRLAPLTSTASRPPIPPLDIATRPPIPPLDIATSLGCYTFPAAKPYNDQGSTTSSPIEPRTPASLPSSRNVSLSSTNSGNSRFDSGGQLLSQGARYAIADEILQLQSAPSGGDAGMSHEDVEVLEDYDHTGALATRLRAASEDSTFAKDIKYWRQQQPYLPSRQHSAGLERARSSSLASSNLGDYYPSGLPRPAFERAQTVAQLQTYFGPEQGGPSPVHLPGGFESYTPFPTMTSDVSSPVSRRSSVASQSSAAYPPLAHPEPFNLTRDDPLYIEARDIFVQSTCTSLQAAPSTEHLQTMAQHFDRAMHQLHPLATLFGLSQDAANHLLSDPANSGVDEVVLRVASMMGRQQQMASVQRSAMGTILPGPSPNNRKLGLYKTELCRSWDEVNGCRYGVKCQFAHGVHELREAPRHPKFKSEICRTFWHEGACPYGKRCCFIHAMPETPAPTSPSPRKNSAASSRAPSPRPRGRMTSTAVTGAPARTFGPALSELLGGSVAPPAQSTATKSETAVRSPCSSLTSSSFETSTLFGLGIRERPGQAPPTYKDAPQSRLQRLASRSANASSSSLASLASLGHTASPVKPASSTASGTPHVRHNSATSFISSGSSAVYSPVLTRSGSSSSLSSGAGSPVLHRVAGDWLGGAAPGNTKSSALDWPDIEELSLDQPPAALAVPVPHGPV